MQDLSLTLLQTSLQWENPEANLAHFDRLISRIQGPTDLILLPEMFNTGFSMRADSLAETMEGPTVNWMKTKAAQNQAVVSGSLIIREEKAFYNRLVAALPDGSLQYYNKRHLFRMAGEQLTYTGGNELLTLEIKGWKIRPFVCYDLRFPVWSRNSFDPLAGWQYDLAVYVANWPSARAHAWKSLPVARAIENQAWIATLNRIGSDGKGHTYSGDSQVINSYGETVVHLDEAEYVQTVVLDRNSLEKHREVFPVGRDADRFEIFP